VISTAILLVAQAAPPPAIDWPLLPPLPWRVPPTLSPDMTAFVVGEVEAGRCRTTGLRTLSLDLVVAVRAGVAVRGSTPRSIGCPLVEQFAAGLVDGFARNNLRNTPSGWYRVRVSFTLPGSAPLQ
jgi:hypothetical protein